MTNAQIRPDEMRPNNGHIVMVDGNKITVIKSQKKVNYMAKFSFVVKISRTNYIP